MGYPPADVPDLLSRCGFDPPGTSVVCGVSGGADSLALLFLAREAGLKVKAVHVDHGLRAGSDREADLVASVAMRVGAEFESKSVTVAEGSDLEQRARQARHAALGPDALLGHTADDQAETTIINLLRGSGLYGIAAMKSDRRRPLLRLRRFETRAVCAHFGVEPFHDPSNDDPRFVRNRVRAEVLPLLADIADRDPVVGLNRMASQARSTVTDIDLLASEIDPTDSRGLARQPKTIAIAALREWLRDDSGHPPSGAELERVLAVVNHDRVACEISGRRRIARTDGVLRIESSEP